MTFTFSLDKVGGGSAIKMHRFKICNSCLCKFCSAFDLRNLYVKRMQEFWRCEGKNVFLQSKF